VQSAVAKESTAHIQKVIAWLEEKKTAPPSEKESVIVFSSRLGIEAKLTQHSFFQCSTYHQYFIFARIR
jgi:hypothetical protein